MESVWLPSLLLPLPTATKLTLQLVYAKNVPTDIISMVLGNVSKKIQIARLSTPVASNAWNAILDMN